MPTPDDQQFEKYLKQFCPLDAAPLPFVQPQRLTLRLSLIGAGVALAAAILLAAFMLHRPASTPQPSQQITVASIASEPAAAQPLTIGAATALLAQSPSLKVTLNLMAFPHPSPQLTAGQHSALAVLSKESTL